MSTAARLVKLVEGLDADGVLSATKGGTGNTTGGGTSSPTVSQIAYSGDDTAANPSGGQTITLTGTNFAAGAKVLINTTQVSVVTVVSATQITFTAPALAAGSYILYVVNTNGSTAIAVPGLQVSGVPAWTTAAGTLGTVYETAAVSATVAATSDSAVTYSLYSGTLPTGVTFNSNGTISGTSSTTASSTTYTFTIRATDAENQDTDRSFSLTINPDVVTWSSPANAATLTGTPGVAYSSALSAASAAGKTITYSANTLPAGLAISGSTITGTPTTAGSSSTTLTATSAVTNKTAQVTISWTITVAADTYFPLTALLLNSETTATPFLADASANNFAVTVNGSTKPSNFNPYTPGYYSNYFDGSGDYITAPASSAWNFTGDWTWECWVNPNAISGFQSVLGQWQSGNNIFIWKINSSGRLYLENLSTAITATSTTVVANQWQHIALTRSSNTIRMFVNGVLDATTATRSGTYYSTAPMNIGFSGEGENFAGYISNMRVVNGTALYTANFTPPTGPLTAVANTSLLTCQSNRFIDSSTNSFTITRAGDTKVSGFIPFQPNTSYSTYGSTYLNGTTDYLTVPQNAAFNFGTGDFTVEGWWNFNNISISQGLISLGTGANGGGPYNGWWFDYESSGILRFYRYAGGAEIYSSFSVTLVPGTWYHIACTRSGTAVKMFVNGVQVGTTATSSTSFDNVNSDPLVIGRFITGQGTFYLDGYVSDVRIVKGTALYTTNFTPPATPLTAVANTSLLTCQGNQPNNNQTFLDNSSNALPVTRAGNATQGSFAPYGANWSNYFNGSTDYLDINYTALQNYAGNATIECWFKLNALPTGTSYTDSMYIIGGNPYNSNPGIDFAIGSNAIWFNQADYTQRTLTGTWTPNLNWHHIAVTRNTNTWTMWLDGVSIATATSSNAFANTTVLAIGRDEPTVGDTSGYMNGYISNLRIVNGTALYTSAFTPSTQPLTAITGTSLLTCQSPNFTDNSLNASVITPKGTISTQKFNPFATVTQTPQSYSNYFGAANGNSLYLSAQSSGIGGITLTGNYTIEMWLYPTAASNSGYSMLIATNTDGGYFQYSYNSSGQLGYYTPGFGDIKTSASSITFNTWQHVALVRSSNVTKIYVNGVEKPFASTNTDSSSIYANYIGGIGTVYNTFGYISNLRINNTALYTTAFTPATTALTAVSGTQLLTCQDATVRDNSTNQFTLTSAGTVVPRQQNPFGFTTSATQDYSTTTFGASAYFDGTDDKLTVANYTGLAFGTNDFTIQGWFYTIASTTEQVFATNGWSSYAPWLIRIDASNTIKLNMSTSGGGWDINEASFGTVVPNQWYHVAVTRKSGTIRAFLNGVQQYTASLASSLYNGSQALNIGGRSDSTVPFKGYLSDVHLVNGTALYTSNFVPPQAPLTGIQNTTLLLNMDKAAIADKSGKVVLETVGDAKVSTAIKKYGNSSMYFDGTGDYLSIPINPSLTFGTRDFTVETWIYLPSISGNWGIVGLGTNGFFAQVNSGNNIHVSQAGVVDLADFTISPTLSANTWYHFAITRSGTSMKAFINGVQQGSTVTNSTDFTGTNAALIGGHPGGIILYSGYMDDLRITKGVARYTTTFTPPSSALITK
jgi:hypothetical protein